MFHIFKRKLRYYLISKADKALDQHRKDLKRTASQEAEFMKYQRINQLRDHACSSTEA